MSWSRELHIRQKGKGKYLNILDGLHSIKMLFLFQISQTAPGTSARFSAVGLGVAKSSQKQNFGQKANISSEETNGLLIGRGVAHVYGLKNVQVKNMVKVGI